MQISECTFSGIPKCLKLSGDGIELIVTLSFGPRIISCKLDGGENFFRVFEKYSYKRQTVDGMEIHF